MKNYDEIYVSVDVESTGPIPGEFSMSAIGAFVAGGRNHDGTFEHFNHKDTKNIFYAEIAPISDNYIPQAINIGLLEGFDNSIPDPDGSRHFEWMKTHGEDPEIAMRRFSEFVKNAEKKFGAKAVFMAYPASFDWTFVYWYLIKFLNESPFGFSRVIDLKTTFAIGANVGITKSSKRSMPKSLFPKLPHTHKASDDATEQGILGINLLEWSTQK